MTRPRLQKFLDNLTPRQLARQLNELADDIRHILDGGISIVENVSGDVKTIDYVSTALPIYISTVSRSAPIAVAVLNCTVLGDTSGVYTTGNVVTWRFSNGGQVRIDDIDGLTAGTRYAVRLALVAG